MRGENADGAPGMATVSLSVPVSYTRTYLPADGYCVHAKQEKKTKQHKKDSEKSPKKQPEIAALSQENPKNTTRVFLDPKPLTPLRSSGDMPPTLVNMAPHEGGGPNVHSANVTDRPLS